MRTKLPSILLAALAVSALSFSACSSNTASSLPETAPTAAARPTQPPAEPVVAAAETTPQSVFTVDVNSRDPFFPKARPVQAEVAPTPGEVALDVPALLQAKLHGIITSGGKSIAYVGNTMLEEGLEAVIPIRAGGHERQVNVRCRTVTRDSVVLEVQGYTQPVRLTRSTR